MKKILLLLIGIILSFMPSFADVVPYSINDISRNSIGVYQAENKFQLRKEPRMNSEVLLEATWSEYGTDFSPEDVFVAFYPQKNLGFFAVLDESEDMEWLKIVYKKNKTAWVKITDAYRYSTWRNFVNDYGRKYGMSYLRGVPDNYKSLYGSPDDNSKIIATLVLPKIIKLSNVSGNWALVIIYDIDNSQKIGWLKWRMQDGAIYMFPKIH